MATLIPALELEPGTYATRDHPVPNGSGIEDPQGWADYWAESLADSGIVGLTKLEVGYALVALSQVTASPILRIILRKSLEIMTDWDLDELGPLTGGYVLQHHDKAIAPGCCGDLSNLDNWLEAAAYTSERWAMVWIGHPWTHICASGDTLYLSEPNETDSGTMVEAICLERQELLDAVEVARRERDSFGESLRPLIAELVPPRVSVQSVLDVLLRGHSRSPGSSDLR